MDKKTFAAMAGLMKTEKEGTALFDVDDFVDKLRLPCAVADALREEGFATREALLGIQAEDFDILKLKTGHRRAIESAISAMKTKESTMAATGGKQGGKPDRFTGPNPVGILDQLLGQANADDKQQGRRVSERMDLDPSVYLRRGKAAERPLYIVDFLPKLGLHAKDCEEVELGDGVTIKLNEQKKSKLEPVSPAQWISANACIMAELIRTDKLNEHSSVDYLAYTAKIGELACRYTWISVLAYDCEYREKQAEFQFRWGADGQHLTTVRLKERGSSVITAPKKFQSSFRGARQTKPVCWQFNKGKCFYGTRCNFDHVCSSCGKDHPLTDHDQSGDKPDKEWGILVTHPVVASPFTSDYLASKNSLSSKLSIWESELECDTDREYLMNGLEYGFRISDSDICPHKAISQNHKSAVSVENKELVEKEIKKQIDLGHYIVSTDSPTIVSPMAAIPKDISSVRLIHDGSRPVGEAMNDCTFFDNFIF